MPMAVGAGGDGRRRPRLRRCMQFLLGIDAPVSLLLLRQMLATIIVNTLLALPGLRRSCAAGLLPALPDDPRRRRRRRAYTTGGLSPLSRVMIDPAGDRRTPISPQLACASPCSACRLRAVRRHLLPPLVPAGPVRRPVPQAGADQPGPARAHRGAARRDRRPQRRRARREPPVQRRQARPGQAAAPSEKAAVARYGQQVIARVQARPRAARATRPRSRPCRPT